MCGGHKKIVICALKDKRLLRLEENIEIEPRLVGCDNIN
jgi:hypothetical protein